MSEQVASHSDEVQQGLTDEQYAEIMREFGYGEPQQEAQQTEQSEEEEELEQSEEPPATEESKKLKVKYNKQEIEIDEDKVPEYVQKGLALEKEREKKSEYEKALQRAAKLEGFDKVDDYLANLDKIEQQRIKQQEDRFAEQKRLLLEEAENMGMDVEKFSKYLDDHPLFKQAQEVLSKQEQEIQAQKQQKAEQVRVAGWQSLFEKYPDLAQELNDAGEASWLTAEMKSRLDKGYDPIDAYELVHRDKILEDERNRTKQDVIKQQRLNKRAAVEKATAPEVEDDVPEKYRGVADVVKGAFAMFGLDPKSAKKYMK